MQSLLFIMQTVSNALPDHQTQTISESGREAFGRQTSAEWRTRTTKTANGSFGSHSAQESRCISKRLNWKRLVVADATISLRFIILS